MQKLRILIKLRNYNNTYLLIGRLIDEKIIDHIDRTNGTAQEYFRLKSHIFDLEVNLDDGVSEGRHLQATFSFGEPQHWADAFTPRGRRE